MLKRAVSRLSIVHFQVNYADYASLFALELEKLLLNNKTTALCQANMSPKHCIKPYQRLQTTTKNKLWKTLMLTSFQKLQLQSVSIFFKFVHDSISYSPCYLHFLMFWAVCFFMFHSIWWQIQPLSNKFNDTAPLSVGKKVLHPEIWLEDQWSSSWTNFVKEVST